MLKFGGATLYGEPKIPMFMIAFLLAGTLTGVVIVTLGAMGASRVLKPIGGLSAAMKKFGEGDLSTRVPVQSGDELGVMAAVFNGMANRLQEAIIAHDKANNAKSDLIRNVSHELRTPLTAIKGYCEMLQDQTREKAEDGMLADLNVIHSQAIHLNSLVDDLLIISKIEADKMEFKLQHFDPTKLARAAAAAGLPRAAARKNTLVFDSRGRLGTMHGDMARLRQCLDNLLTNACKFTENGTITLTLSAAAVNGVDGVAFQVVDTGIGMKQDLIGRLFEPFQQGEEKKGEGFGLGLSITRKLARKMGGDVTVSSVLGKGFTFTLLLPLDMRMALPDASELPPDPTLVLSDTDVNLIVPAAEAPSANGAQQTILVIDDDPTLREMLTRVLAKEGFRAVTCSGGEQGVLLAKQVRPQAIILDVLMPSMDGWKVLSALKADAELADIPVIMLTIVDDRSRAMSLGASEFLNKPMDRNRLLDALHKRCRLPPSRAGP